MKNIVKVLRFKDNATRLYQLPAHYALSKGTVVEVEFAGGTAFGVTVSESYCGDYEEKMLRDLFNVLPATEFKRVVAVYDKSDVSWVDSTAAETAEEATEQEATEQEATAAANEEFGA